MIDLRDAFGGAPARHCEYSVGDSIRYQDMTERTSPASADHL